MRRWVRWTREELGKTVNDVGFDGLPPPHQIFSTITLLTRIPGFRFCRWFHPQASLLWFESSSSCWV